MRLFIMIFMRIVMVNIDQPFPAIYSRKGLEKMTDAKSLQQLLQQGNTCALGMPDGEQFSNYNKLP